MGFHDLGNTGFNTDVWSWTTRDGRVFATSGTWGAPLAVGVDPCPSEPDNPLAPVKSGVKIVDVTDPSNPQMAARIGTFPGSQNNDVKVVRLETGASGAFEGRDILVHSLEPCDASILVALAQGGAVPDVPLPHTGFELYDVTEPSGPVPLATYHNGGLGTHNLYPFTRPDLGRALVATVLNEQSLLSGIRGEVQFVEITDPSGGLDGLLGPPVSTWELADAAAQGGPTVEEMCIERGTHLQACVLHDVWVSEDGRTAYLSFWDAGLILLDISSPEAPTFAGQVQSGTLEDEGNTHAAVPLLVDGRHLVVVGDEDFVGGGGLQDVPTLTVNAAPAGAPVSAGEQFSGTEFTASRPLEAGSVGPLPVFLADDEFGCDWTTALTSGVVDWVGVARRGGPEPCNFFQTKFTVASGAGADGLIVVNNNPGHEAGLAAGAIPGMMIDRDQGNRLIDALDPGSPAVLVTLELVEREIPVEPWGFMRLFDASDPASMVQVSTFEAPHVRDEDPGPENIYSAHNPIVGPDGRVYFSWYTNGVRVLEVDAGAPVSERAWFAPLPTDHEGDLDADPRGIQEDNIGFWASMALCHPGTGDLLVFNSDFNRGLYILRALYDHPCSEQPAAPLKASGGGRAPSSVPDESVTFGFNAGSEGGGTLHLLDHGTGQRVVSTGVASVEEVSGSDGRTVRISGTCSVDGGPDRACQATATYGGSGGSDVFRLEVRDASGLVVYSGGGELRSGNVKVR